MRIRHNNVMYKSFYLLSSWLRFPKDISEKGEHYNLLLLYLSVLGNISSNVYILSDNLFTPLRILFFKVGAGL